MNKEELIKRIAERTGVAQKDTRRVVDEFFEVVKESLESGEEILIRGWGTFLMKERAARIARNPKTGKEIKIPARKVPFFRIGRKFKKIIMEVKKNKKSRKK